MAAVSARAGGARPSVAAAAAAPRRVRPRAADAAKVGGGAGGQHDSTAQRPAPPAGSRALSMRQKHPLRMSKPFRRPQGARAAPRTDGAGSAANGVFAAAAQAISTSDVPLPPTVKPADAEEDSAPVAASADAPDEALPRTERTAASARSTEPVPQPQRRAGSARRAGAAGETRPRRTNTVTNMLATAPRRHPKAVFIGSRPDGVTVGSMLKADGHEVGVAGVPADVTELAKGVRTSPPESLVCLAALGGDEEKIQAKVGALRSLATAAAAAKTLSVAVVALPSAEEVGAHRCDVAEAAAEALLEGEGAVDALIVLDEVACFDTPFVLAEHAGGLMQLLRGSSRADARRALRGRAVLGVGKGPAAEAARKALAACAVPETAMPRSVVYSMHGCVSIAAADEVGAVVRTLAHPNAVLAFDSTLAPKGGEKGMVVIALASRFHGIGNGFLADSARAAALAELAMATPGIDRPMPKLQYEETAVHSFLSQRAKERASDSAGYLRRHSEAKGRAASSLLDDMH